MKNSILCLLLLIAFTEKTTSFSYVMFHIQYVGPLVFYPPPVRPQPTEKTRDFEELYASAIKRCTRSYEVDLDDVFNTLCKFKVPQMDKFPCWLYCFLDEFDIVKGKQINWKKAREYTKYRLLPFNYDSGVDTLYNLCEIEVKYKLDYESFCDLGVDYLRCQIQYWDHAGLPKNKKSNTTIP